MSRRADLLTAIAIGLLAAITVASAQVEMRKEVYPEPSLRDAGMTAEELHKIMIDNPTTLLGPSPVAAKK